MHIYVWRPLTSKESKSPLFKMVIKFLACFLSLLVFVAPEFTRVENKFSTLSPEDAPVVRASRCCSSSSSSSESSESGSSSSQEKGWRVVFNDPRTKSGSSGHKVCPCGCGAAGSPYYCAFIAASPKRPIPHDWSSSSSSAEKVPSPCSWNSISLSKSCRSDESSSSYSSSSSSSS